MKQMIASGLDAARINCSHAVGESRLNTVNMLKQAREEMGKSVALLLDTKGPEIRTKTFANGKVSLEQGQDFTLTTRDIVGDETIVAVTYQDLPTDLRVGNRVLFDDGLIEMSVTAIEGTEVKCTLINSGVLGSRKGINIPDVVVNLPSLTEQDVEDIKFGIKEEFDFIAASFVRTANDIVNIRKVLEANGGEHIRIIAKIESRDGVNNLDSILEVADGVMVARGDLGVEIPPEEVPIVQKNMIRSCNLMGKPVITATHMLESMVSNPRPTRAEANDVANAIFDGTDVVMLSGETANGQYPIEAINMMDRIARKAENNIDYSEISLYRNITKNITNTMSFAGVAAAEDLGAACIVPITDSGFAARMVSRSRPNCPILAVTNDPVTCRQLNLSWGCIPVLSEKPFKGDAEVFDIAEEMAMKSGLAKSGDIIVAMAGVPVGLAGTTNTIRVRTCGNVLAKGTGNKMGTVRGITRHFSATGDDDRASFERGDIVICTHTDDKMVEHLKSAGGLVVGSWENVDLSHAETVARALEIPMLQVKVRANDFVKSGTPVTLDTSGGLLINGYQLT